MLLYTEVYHLFGQRLVTLVPYIVNETETVVFPSEDVEVNLWVGFKDLHVISAKSVESLRSLSFNHESHLAVLV